MRKFTLAGLFTLLSLSLALSAAVYNAPAIPGGKDGIVTITKNSYSFTNPRPANNTIPYSASGKYNYDNGCTFSNLTFIPYWIDNQGVDQQGTTVIYSNPENPNVIPGAGATGDWSVSGTLGDLPNGTQSWFSATLNILNQVGNKQIPGAVDAAGTAGTPITVPNRN